MKKIFMVIISLFLLVGCNSKKEENNSNLNNNVSNSNVISNSNISSNSNSNTNINYDESKVGTYKVNFYLFHLSTCPHCHEELKWLESIEKQYPYLNIIKHEVQEDSSLYEKVVEKMGINDYHVPLTIIGNDYIIGYSNEKNDELINLIKKYSTFSSCDVVKTIENNGNIDNCKKNNEK